MPTIAELLGMDDKEKKSSWSDFADSIPDELYEQAPEIDDEYSPEDHEDNED